MGVEDIERSQMECKHLPNHGYVEGVLKKSEREYLWSLIGDLDALTEKNYGMKVSVQKQLEDKDNYFSSNVLMQYCQEYMNTYGCLLYTSPSPRDGLIYGMTSSA